MASKNTSKTIASRSRKKRVVKNKSSLTWLWITLGIVAVVIMGFIILQPSLVSPREISVKQAYEKYQQKVPILDVREIDEWNQSRIPGSIHIPLDELTKRLDEIPKNQELMIICRSGNRSLEAANLLIESGYTSVVSISGGLNDWSSSGYPVELGYP